jgi:hypothetical protein
MENNMTSLETSTTALLGATEMADEVKENVRITIEVVLKSLRSPETNEATRLRLGDSLIELREIVEYLYSHKAKEQLDRETFDYFDIKMAGIIEECGRSALKSAFA